MHSLCGFSLYIWRNCPTVQGNPCSWQFYHFSFCLLELKFCFLSKWLLWIMRVDNWYYDSRKIQQIIFAFLKIAHFRKNRVFTWQRWYALSTDRSMQPVIHGNCHFHLLFLSAEITMFQLVSFGPSVLCLYLHNDKITHSIRIIALNMCKWIKYPSVEIWLIHQMWNSAGFVFFLKHLPHLTEH